MRRIYEHPPRDVVSMHGNHQTVPVFAGRAIEGPEIVKSEHTSKAGDLAESQRHHQEFQKSWASTVSHVERGHDSRNCVVRAAAKIHTRFVCS